MTHPHCLLPVHSPPDRDTQVVDLVTPGRAVSRLQREGYPRPVCSHMPSAVLTHSLETCCSSPWHIHLQVLCMAGSFLSAPQPSSTKRFCISGRAPGKMEIRAFVQKLIHRAKHLSEFGALCNRPTTFSYSWTVLVSPYSPFLKGILPSYPLRSKQPPGHSLEAIVKSSVSLPGNRAAFKITDKARIHRAFCLHCVFRQNIQSI